MYTDMCSSTECRLPVDLLDEILYAHSDIDARVRLRAPPRRIPKAVLHSLDALIEARDGRVCVRQTKHAGMAVGLLLGEAQGWLPGTRNCYMLTLDAAGGRMVWDCVSLAMGICYRRVLFNSHDSESKNF